MKKHRTPIQIRFKDIDALGHVNNANHLTYFESARVKYFDELMGSNIDWNNIGLILASTTVNYKMPILIKDDVSVLTWVTRIGKSSFDLAYEIVKSEKGSDVLLATGSSVMVCYDYKSKTPTEIPSDWRVLLEKELS